jgi:hypothetical protein
LRITEEQFEEIKALVIKETGAIVSFYDKKEFVKKIEGYCVFEEPYRLFVCRSRDKKCYNRATLVLLHEAGHLIDYFKHKNSPRMQAIVFGIDNYDPTRVIVNDAFKLSKKEQVWILKTEWYANFYAKKFAIKHNLNFLFKQLDIEQITDYKYVHSELVLGQTANRDTVREWHKILKNKKNRILITLADVNALRCI